LPQQEAKLGQPPRTAYSWSTLDASFSTRAEIEYRTKLMLCFPIRHQLGAKNSCSLFECCQLLNRAGKETAKILPLRTSDLWTKLSATWAIHGPWKNAPGCIVTPWKKKKTKTPWRESCLWRQQYPAPLVARIARGVGRIRTSAVLSCLCSIWCGPRPDYYDFIKPEGRSRCGGDFRRRWTAKGAVGSSRDLMGQLQATLRAMVMPLHCWKSWLSSE